MYFIFLVLPILIPISCEWPSGGSYTTSECLINISIMHGIANLVAGVLMLSVFLLFVPIIIYICIVLGVTEIVVKSNKKT
jgi:hypothetical protein